MAAVGGLNDHAASNDCIELCRLNPQPFAGRAILGFGKGFGFHGESSGEHFRQDDQIRPPRLLQQHLEMFKVGLAVMPGQAGLDQRQVQIR
ncbi:hypothetical protein D3C72_1002050 [compost metagenome]